VLAPVPAPLPEATALAPLVAPVVGLVPELLLPVEALPVDPAPLFAAAPLFAPGPPADEQPPTTKAPRRAAATSLSSPRRILRRTIMTIQYHGPNRLGTQPGMKTTAGVWVAPGVS